MEVSLYDKVLLTTGKTAYIVEIYEPGNAYEADIDRKDGGPQLMLKRPIRHFLPIIFQRVVMNAVIFLWIYRAMCWDVS